MPYAGLTNGKILQHCGYMATGSISKFLYISASNHAKIGRADNYVKVLSIDHSQNKITIDPKTPTLLGLYTYMCIEFFYKIQ